MCFHAPFSMLWWTWWCMSLIKKQAFILSLFSSKCNKGINHVWILCVKLIHVLQKQHTSLTHTYDKHIFLLAAVSLVFIIFLHSCFHCSTAVVPTQEKESNFYLALAPSVFLWILLFCVQPQSHLSVDHKHGFGNTAVKAEVNKHVFAQSCQHVAFFLVTNAGPAAVCSQIKRL